MTLLKCHESFSWFQVFIHSTAFPDCSHSVNNTYTLSTYLLIHSKLPGFSRSPLAGSVRPNCFTIHSTLLMRWFWAMLRAAQLAWQRNVLQRTFTFGAQCVFPCTNTVWTACMRGPSDSTPSPCKHVWEDCPQNSFRDPDTTARNFL